MCRDDSLTGMLRRWVAALVLVTGALLTPASVSAQERCAFFCAPELKIEPTATVESLFAPGRFEVIEDGQVVETVTEERAKVFELILAVGIPTAVPRVGFTFETIFVPFGETDVHPFTGSTASEVGGPIRDNGVEIEIELNLGIVEPEQTGGWLESHFDIVDKFSPGARPGSTSVYTHKLNFELDTAVLIFNGLPEGNWLRNVEAEVSLDYVATGIPKAGDDFGSIRWLTDASPWSISFVAVLPLAP